MRGQDILRYIVIGLIMLVPLSALVVSNSTYFPFIVGKNVLFRVLVELAAAGWLVLGLAEPRYRPRYSWLVVAVAAFVAVATVADAAGVNPLKSIWSNFERMEGLVMMLHLLAYFLVAAALLTTERLWGWFLHIFIGVSVLVGLFGLLSADKLQLTPRENPLFYNLINPSLRGGGTLGNPIYLAIFLLFNAFWAGFYLLRSWGRNVYLSAAYGLVIIFNVVLMFLTETRGTALGFFAALGVMAVLTAVLERERPVVRLTAAALALLGALTAGVFTFALIQNNYSPAAAETSSLVQTVNQVPFVGNLATINLVSVNSATTRFYIWGIALEGAAERPSLGWGQDNFSYVFNKHYDPVLHSREQWFDRAHNTFLDWLTAAGVAGLLAYVLLYVGLMWFIWRDPRDNWSLYEKVVLTGMVAAYTVHNLFVFDSLTSYLMFFALLAFVAARGTGGSRPYLLERFSLPSTTAYAAAAPVVVVLLVGSLYVSAYKPLAASQELITAMSLNRQGDHKQGLESFRDALAYADGATGAKEVREQLALQAVEAAQAQSSQSVGRDYIELANEQMELHTERFPKETRPFVFWGQMLSKLGQYDQAEAAFKQALENSPRKQTIRLQLVVAYLNRGQYERAVELSRRTFEMERNFDQARIMYASSLRYAGEDERAEELLEPLGQSVLFENALLRPYIDRGEFQRVIDIRRQRLAALRERLAEDPEDESMIKRVAQEWTSLAATYQQMDNIPKAVRELERIKEEFPQFTEQVDGFIERLRSGKKVFE